MHKRAGETVSEQSAIARCGTCGTPLVEDKPLDDIKRVFDPYHACVSWTYIMGDRAEEALLRIRRDLKVAAGWWNESEQAQWEDAMRERGCSV